MKIFAFFSSFFRFFAKSEKEKVTVRREKQKNLRACLHGDFFVENIVLLHSSEKDKASSSDKGEML